eukprot:TRINITY_DN72_c0_g1_i2.p1 TRINITY_DN72_c0_g1~~TRINITY_DN72_c0_g1_i2.p1  ORF type:complete len:496 (-),score=174.59 TRINITY_DN72_c0_g1_i2:81-1568(-)
MSDSSSSWSTLAKVGVAAAGVAATVGLAALLWPTTAQEEEEVRSSQSVGPRETKTPSLSTKSSSSSSSSSKKLARKNSKSNNNKNNNRRRSVEGEPDDNSNNADNNSREEKEAVESKAREFCEYAKRFFQQEQYSTALQFYEQALKLTPEDAKIYLNMSRVHMRLKDAETAKQMADVAIFLEQDLWDAYYLKGLALMSVKDFESAREALMSAAVHVKSEPRKYEAFMKKVETCDAAIAKRLKKPTPAPVVSRQDEEVQQQQEIDPETNERLSQTAMRLLERARDEQIARESERQEELERSESEIQETSPVVVERDAQELKESSEEVVDVKFLAEQERTRRIEEESFLLAAEAAQREAELKQVRVAEEEERLRRVNGDFLNEVDALGAQRQAALKSVQEAEEQERSRRVFECLAESVAVEAERKAELKLVLEAEEEERSRRILEFMSEDLSCESQQILHYVREEEEQERYRRQTEDAPSSLLHATIGSRFVYPQDF